jgi:hypothetical protein
MEVVPRIPTAPSRRVFPIVCLSGIGTGIYPNGEDALDRPGCPGKTGEPEAALAEVHGTRYQCRRRLHAALREVHWDLFDAGAK